MTLFEALQPDSPYVFYSDDHGFCINTADVMDLLTMDKESVIYRQAAIDEIRKCRFVVDAIERIRGLPSAQPTYTDEEIQKMQDLESAEIEKAYQLGYEEGKKDARPDVPDINVGDMVSRQAVLKICRRYWHPTFNPIMEEVEKLPSEQPVQKKGVWLSKNLPICIGAKELVEVYICSNCGHVVDSNDLSNFCSVCGYDMRGER